MRQGHQNRNRGRNRNNGGSRKGQSPISRSYESNGPDVKIRGTPAHIAEKYMTLARDAQSNGDPVLAENYLQHGEHYNRIILAYRDQMAQQASEGGEQRNGQGGQRPQRNFNAEPVTYEDAGLDADGGEDMASAPQPRSSGNDQTRSPRQQGRGRSGSQNRPRPDRGGSSNRRASGRSEGGGDQPGAEASADPGGVPEHEQPEFLKRSVKRTRRSSASDQGEQPAVADSGSDSAD